jgi:hypothetical protein
MLDEKKKHLLRDITGAFGFIRVGREKFNVYYIGTELTLFMGFVKMRSPRFDAVCYSFCNCSLTHFSTKRDGVVCLRRAKS